MCMVKKAVLSKSMVVSRPLGLYDTVFLEMVEKMGGFNNAHAHLDRADTLPAQYLEHIGTSPIEMTPKPLWVKQYMTGDLHRGIAYTEEDLRERMNQVILRQIEYGTTRLETCIDATTGIAEDGLLAFRVALEMKQKFADRINIEVGPMPIFGFKKGTARWDIFCEAAKSADFISALPEKDDFTDPHKRDGKVGFKAHLRMVMELGCRLQKPVCIHLDQANDPRECGSETLIEGLRQGWLEAPEIPGYEGPTVWIIHFISPTCYTEERFGKLADGLVEFNVGVKSCPSAAIDMRQLRPILTPTHNCIARILDLSKRRVPVMLGTDNIGDVYVAQTNGDLLREVIFAGHALRFAPPIVWAKLAAGVPLNNVDRDKIVTVLDEDTNVNRRIDPSWKPAV